MVQNASRNINVEFVFAGFDTLEKPVPVGIVILVAYILVLLANLTNMYFIITDKRLHQPMYVFICNLAIVDMLYCTCSCPTMISILLIGYKTISYVPCIMQMYGFGLGFVMEVTAIFVMAFDRLVAIIKPLHYQAILTTARAFILSFLLWILMSSVVAFIPGTLVPLPLCSSTIKYVFCDYAAVVRVSCVDPNPYFNMISIVSSFFMFGTLGFIFLSYFQIVIVVVKMTSKGSKKKVFHTCLSHLCVIVSYYGPVFIMVALTRIGVDLTVEERNALRIWTILGPSLVNPFVYSLRTKEIRNRILGIISKVEPTK